MTDADRSATRIGDLRGRPTAAERLVQRDGVGQHLLVAGEQGKLRGHERTLVSEHFELCPDADLELRLGLRRSRLQLLYLLLQFLVFPSVGLEVDERVLD